VYNTLRKNKLSLLAYNRVRVNRLLPQFRDLKIKKGKRNRNPDTILYLDKGCRKAVSVHGTRHDRNDSQASCRRRGRAGGKIKFKFRLHNTVLQLAWASNVIIPGYGLVSDMPRIILRRLCLRY